MNNQERSDLESTISHALEEMKAEQGGQLELKDVNLAELSRRTGVSRKRLRKIKKDGFVIKEHGLKGSHHKKTVLTGYTGLIDDCLRQGNSNSRSILDQLEECGYSGGQTQIKEYISLHKDLLPSKRAVVDPQGNRGRRYTSLPGEKFQMDWGFVNVEEENGQSYRASCFAMICHHCGERYVEFFPNAKQENLFIGMIHAFQRMGVPRYVLTDNMKSVVNGRDSNGHPIWNRDYETFMKNVGFETILCRPRHPFTKGAVERLVQFVKKNFMAGRVFSNITDLNYEALQWCDAQNKHYHRGVDCVPNDEHSAHCVPAASKLELTDEVNLYLWPERKISFDGFVNYEGRRFGVPFWYTGHTVRISRQEYTIEIYSDDLTKKLAEHNVTWSKKDSFCKDQYADEQPEELPTAPVNVTMRHKNDDHGGSGLDDFNFDKEVEW